MGHVCSEESPVTLLVWTIRYVVSQYFVINKALQLALSKAEWQLNILMKWTKSYRTQRNSCSNVTESKGIHKEGLHHVIFLVSTLSRLLQTIPSLQEVPMETW